MNKSEIIELIESLFAKRIEIGEHFDQKTARGIVAGFPLFIENVNDGRKIRIPVSVVGEIRSPRTFDKSNVIKDLPTLYENSVLGWSEPEAIFDGHKRHANVKEYHQYINKFSDGSDEYYIRFTVSEEKGSGRNSMYSATLSEISIYKKDGNLNQSSDYARSEAGLPPFVDRKLQKFLTTK
ncbi:MAG: hypothetical protein FWE23_10620 [Chitinivibrionia bacterium]|nr:hypothetical protein [Chitinivibrionia bacterium]